MNKRLLFSVAAASTAAVATAGVMDREKGLKIGERLTLLPSVSFSYTYDSNVDSSKHSRSGSQWSVNPGLHTIYLGDEWKLDFDIYYTYHAYSRYTSQLDSSTYGERLRFDWADSAPDEAGWRVLFSEKFDQISQDDDMSNHDGRGIGRDRKQLTVEGVIERRLNSRLHADVNASYYYLDYDNNVKKYAPMYGWKRTLVGGEAGYMASKWTDLLVAANYMWLNQDNDRNYGGHLSEARGKHIGSKSDGWTVMGGVATRATEKLAYKLMGGYSRFEYGDGVKDLGGFVYQANADWQMDADNTLHMMLVAASYYQPSEREYGSAIKVYNVSYGLGKGFIRNKLRGTLDLSYRKETHEYSEFREDDYDVDVWTGRVGLSYVINRFLSVYARLEYQNQDADNRYDYDRWRGTVGFMLSY